MYPHYGEIYLLYARDFEREMYTLLNYIITCPNSLSANGLLNLNLTLIVPNDTFRAIKNNDVCTKITIKLSVKCTKNKENSCFVVVFFVL